MLDNRGEPLYTIERSIFRIKGCWKLTALQEDWYFQGRQARRQGTVQDPGTLAKTFPSDQMPPQFRSDRRFRVFLSCQARRFDPMAAFAEKAIEESRNL